MGRLIAGVLLLVSALFGGYGAIAALTADLDAALGEQSLPYLRRTLEPGLLAIVVAAAAHAVAAATAWRGGLRWRGWAVAGVGIAVLVVLAWVVLLGASATRASAYAGAGLVLGPAVAMIALGVLALLLAPRKGGAARGAGAARAEAVTDAIDLPTDATAQSCPDGCVAVSGTPVPVTECFLFIFCDTYTLTPFDCMDAADTSAPCPADAPAPPPPPEPDDQQQLVFVCIGNLGGDEVAVVVYDFTCQIVYRIVDSILREWG